MSEATMKRLTLGLLVGEVALSLVVICLLGSQQGCGREAFGTTQGELVGLAMAEGTDELVELADAMMAASDRGDTVQAERLARVLEEAMGLMPDEQGAKEEKR